MAARIRPRVKIVKRDKGYDAFMRKINESKSASVLVGITAEKGAVAHKDSKQTVLDVATANEFGLGVPERSFLRGWFDANLKGLGTRVNAVAKAIALGKRSKARGLQLLGVWLVGEVQKYITTGPFLPNAPETIQRKGSSKPLIDKGQLRSSVTYRIDIDEVVESGSE